MRRVSVRLPGCWPLTLSWSFSASTSHHEYGDRSRPWFKVLRDLGALNGRGRCTNRSCALTGAGVVHGHDDGSRGTTIDDPVVPYSTTHRVWVYFDRYGPRAAVCVDLALRRDYP